MKTSNFFKTIFAFILVTLFVSGSLFAGNPAEGLAIKYQPIRDKFEKTIKFPANCTTNFHSNESAEVLFTLTDEGKVNVVSVDCQCPELAESVKKQLEAIYCKDVIHEYNQHFKVTIHFKTA